MSVYSQETRLNNKADNLKSLMSPKTIKKSYWLISQLFSITSKCSFLDNEPLSKQENYAGKRLKRGLFCTSDGRLINADVNASANIIRKVASNAFAEGVEGVVVRPSRLAV